MEVADILRAQGDRFLDRYEKSFDFRNSRLFGPFSVAERPRWAVTQMPVHDAAIRRLFPITLAETGTVPSVRYRRAHSGWQRENENFSPPVTFMWSSPSHMN